MAGEGICGQRITPLGYFGSGLRSTDYAAALFRERIERMGRGFVQRGYRLAARHSGDSHSGQVTVTLLGECATSG